MSTAQELVSEIKEAAQAIGIAPTTLCQRAVMNSNLIRRIEAGQKVTSDTVDRIRAYIAAHKPKSEAAE